MSVDFNNESILQHYMEVLSKLGEIVDEDVMVMITDWDQVLAYYPGTKMVITEKLVGKATKDFDHIYAAIKNGKLIKQIVPVGKYNFPFLSINYPIKDPQDKVIGCAAIGKSLERQYYVEQVSQALAATFQEFNASLQEIATGAQGLSHTINDVVNYAAHSLKDIKEVNQVIAAIKDISYNSNLLGLNAAIEAARVGELGRGFTVVADEMRKLASQSNESAQMANDILTTMKNSIEKIRADINQISVIAENQSAALEEASAALQEINGNCTKIVDLSRCY